MGTHSLSHMSEEKLHNPGLAFFDEDYNLVAFARYDRRKSKRFGVFSNRLYRLSLTRVPPTALRLWVCILFILWI